jgi:hypothetical protein
MNQEEQGKKISQVIAKCWADEGFKQKVLADPVATLKAEGVELPAGMTYVAHEDTDKVVHLIIPAKPTGLSDDDLSDAVLTDAVGGYCGCGFCKMSQELGHSAHAMTNVGTSNVSLFRLMSSYFFKR